MATKRTTSRSPVSGVAVWRVVEDEADPAASVAVSQAADAVRTLVTGWCVVAWTPSRLAPRVVVTGSEGDALDPSCWHLLFGSMLLGPLLDVRTGAPFRDPPARRQEIDVFVNRVRDLVVPGAAVLATAGPADDVDVAADAIHDALGPRAALPGARVGLTTREAATVARTFVDRAPVLAETG